MTVESDCNLEYNKWVTHGNDHYESSNCVGISNLHLSEKNIN